MRGGGAQTAHRGGSERAFESSRVGVHRRARGLGRARGGEHLEAARPSSPALARGEQRGVRSRGQVDANATRGRDERRSLRRRLGVDGV